MYKVIYKVNIEVITPFNINNGEKEEDFINSYTVRLNGKPFIPGSTVKGKIKANFFSILDDIHHKENNCECIMCKIFGTSGYNPSKIYVDNFTTNQEKRMDIRYGNSLSRFRKVCKNTALFLQEIVFNNNFQGNIIVNFDEETYKYKDEIEMSIKLIEYIGSGKSRGMGRVKITLQEVK